MSRLLLIAALLAGISFQFAKDLPPSPGLIAWKGAGVGLLAVWAALRTRGGSDWRLPVMLGLGALGDVLLEAAGTVPGAVAFLAGHIVAIGLYLRWRRSSYGMSAGLAGASGVIVAALGYALTRDAGVAFYAFGLGAMAGSALGSRFAVPLVGAGVLLFVLSDLLIFAKSSLLAESALPGLLIWPTYFSAQALIAIGIVRGLHDRRGTPISVR